MRCPDENALAEYVDNVLDDTARQPIEKHIANCSVCRTVISDLARMQHAADAGTNDSTLDNSLGPPVRGSATTIDAVRQRKRTAHIVPGTMIGEYEVTGVLGTGGMGIVFAAIHPRIGKKAAIKILQRDLAANASAIVRFENEARAVNAIGHPNIVDIFGFGELPNGDPYFVMEHVAGISLQEWIHSQGPVALDHAMPILRPICDALTAAHERGIVHRDLKPGNIMVAGSDDAPRIKVLDFGLAKMARDISSDDLTNPGVVMGTPAFMSPEQFMGREVDQRSDVYALGVLVYQMLTGTYPFVGATPSEIGEQHLHHAPRMPSQIVNIPARVDAIIDRALAKEADSRYPTVAELRRDLERCVAETPARGEVAISAPLQGFGELPTIPDEALVVQARLETAPVHHAWRRTLLIAVSGVVVLVVGWAIFGRASKASSEHAIAVPSEAAPALTAPTVPVPATAVPAPIVERTPIVAPADVDTKPAPAASVGPTKTPVRHAAKPSTPPPHPTAKPKPSTGSAAAAADADVDDMLLEGGAVKKRP